MRKRIESMQSHQIENAMKIEALVQKYKSLSSEIEREAAKDGNIDALVLEECVDTLTQIKMLDPELSLEDKDKILKLYADRLTAKEITKNKDTLEAN